MILEGFEIDNWSCIKHLAVEGLPRTGVVVLSGQNGTGKSSIVEALRACLMDNKSTSKALGRGFPKNSSEKPRVSVTFQAAGSLWRITKQFGSKDSKLESRTTTGDWKLETADPSEAHDRTRQLTGGSDSKLGLHQLLWLTQAEFRLPDPKKFDADVQSRLRSILGVLQTPLDDRFRDRVKENWSRWFGARSKPGEKPKLKKDCPLDKRLATLEEYRAELTRSEQKFQAFEGQMVNAEKLEVLMRDLCRQLEEKTDARDDLQEEYTRSQTRLEAHQRAVERVAEAIKALDNVRKLQQERDKAEQLAREARQAAADCHPMVEEKSRQLHDAEQKLREGRREVQTLASANQERQLRREEVTNRLQQHALKEQLRSLRHNLEQADIATTEHEDLNRQARDRPAPDLTILKKLEENRKKAANLRADLEAAAISLTILPGPGAPAPRLAIDDSPEAEAEWSADGSPFQRSVRRHAAIVWPGWGRLQLGRGSDVRSLDQLEADLAEFDRAFRTEIAQFRMTASDPAALEDLRERVAEKKVRDPQLVRKQDEIRRLAPHGLDALRQEVQRLENSLFANEISPASAAAGVDFPQDAPALEKLAARLKQEIDANSNASNIIQGQIAELEQQIEGDPMVKSNSAVVGLRQQEADFQNKLATLDATAKVLGGVVDRMLSAAEMEQSVREADQALATARGQLETAKLSDSEQTIRERLDAANDGLQAIQNQLDVAAREFHELKGAMSQSEGLHQIRAAAAARVEALARETQRETLESEAYDRLYALFEECREKQLAAVMGPIHDRVLRWMRLLRIGGYHAMDFNDQFLPDKLIAGDGALELPLGEESTGTIEQIGLMVRLALGSMLSTPDEPVVAILDDPLTHSDQVRLDRMRAVLKNASLGDTGAKPPAGPLQIVVFTCHPEWFAIEGAKVIDLSKPDVLGRTL